MSAAAGMGGVVGDPAVVVTEPTSMAIGSGVGWFAGMISCMSSSETGGDASSGGSGLSLKAKSKLGNLPGRVGEKVRDVIRSRGSSGANVQRVGEWADRTLGEAAEAAVKGDPNAETAVKVAKQAGRLGNSTDSNRTNT
jgi:hypothetical protein